MPILYILSLVYAFRLTIFFAGMESAHITKVQLNSFASPILAYCCFPCLHCWKGKNDQEATLVFHVENIALASNVLNQFSNVDLMNRSLIKRRIA